MSVITCFFLVLFRYGIFWFHWKVGMSIISKNNYERSANNQKNVQSVLIDQLITIYHCCTSTYKYLYFQSEKNNNLIFIRDFKANQKKWHSLFVCDFEQQSYVILHHFCTFFCGFRSSPKQCIDHLCLDHDRSSVIEYLINITKNKG